MTRLFLVAVGLLGSCGGWGTPECADDGECDGIAVCDLRSQQCREVECTKSEQCGLGSHCDPVEHTCVGGCGGDEDCIAGEICNFEGQCEPYGCRTTDLDCHYGENCVSGQCVDDPDPHCLPVPTSAPQNTCIGAGGAIACFGDCNVSSNLYCLLPCTAGVADACPRGTNCFAPFSGQTATYCTGDCPFLLDNGF